MVNLPVFPGVNPPNDRELETAYSLLSMNAQGENNNNSDQLVLQEPNIEPHTAQPLETIPELPDLTDMLVPHPPSNLADAMEHVIGYALTRPDQTPLSVPDAMDTICVTLVLVETNNESRPEYALVTPQIEEQLKPCSIKLTRIDAVLSYIPTQNLCQALMHAGKPHTRSKCTPKPPPTPPRCGRSRRSNLQV